ncbi:MAG: histidinol dehydrogenase [Rikenellaceae bacterium]|jgi:histidinol dehydrogenase|nr:histidinol dehydrogenase [Rikenellaceae bacterium]
MIPIYINPPRSEWAELTARATFSDDEITATVERILAEVRTEGDRALERLTRQIEGRTAGGIVVSEKEIAEAEGLVPEELKDALDVAVHNIRRFHEAQRPADVDVEVSAGVRCVQRAVAIQRVGLYVPGGSAPLFSTVLMLAIPAEVAGCPEIVLCTPADKDGRVAPAVLYAARLCGVEHIYKVGGAQAVAAMAYGTETIPRVDKIFGPGNRYVTRAKQLVSAATVAVDMPAGPSEVLVLADGSAPASFAAADMLSQAEHGGDSQALLVCAEEGFAREVLAEIERQLAGLSRAETTAKALDNSRIVVLAERASMIEFANAYAAEHLIIQMSEPWDVAGKITAAGSVFIGAWSPESAGDYASGTNHTLPTAGWARSFSGVNVESFVRRITFQELTERGLGSLARTITTMAEAEGLDAHAAAVKIRLNSKTKD